MDAKMEKLARPFAHYNTICDTGEVNQVTKFVDLLTCGNSIMNNYLSMSPIDDKNQLGNDDIVDKYSNVFLK